jgi:hypothetical protein
VAAGAAPRAASAPSRRSNRFAVAWPRGMCFGPGFHAVREPRHSWGPVLAARPAPSASILEYGLPPMAAYDRGYQDLTSCQDLVGSIASILPGPDELVRRTQKAIKKD